VPAYLAASDVGFLLRQDNPVNHVASPVKFGEYLASGLAVVTSPKLGDVSRLVVERNLGLLVSPEDIEESAKLTERFLSAVIQDREGYRDRSQQAAAELLDWSKQIATWREVLGEPGTQTAKTRMHS
jgi:glycosyltransferase involved in cell wall biosynthesis